MNNAPTRPASGPSAFIICDMSNKVVGQMSGQWVKPKNTRNGRPFIWASVKGLPFWSSRLNGPPMAATACPIGENERPVTKRTAPKIRKRPQRNAASSNVRREAWAFSFAFIGKVQSAETRGKSDADGL